MSDLKVFSNALDEASKKRDEERKAFNTAIGEPAVFVPDQEDQRFGVGYWKAAGGVVAYRKYVNGYDPFSRITFTDFEIDILNKVRDS